MPNLEIFGEILRVVGLEVLFGVEHVSHLSGWRGKKTEFKKELKLEKDNPHTDTHTHTHAHTHTYTHKHTYNEAYLQKFELDSDFVGDSGGWHIVPPESGGVFRFLLL